MQIEIRNNSWCWCEQVIETFYVNTFWFKKKKSMCRTFVCLRRTTCREKMLAAPFTWFLGTWWLSQTWLMSVFLHFFFPFISGKLANRLCFCLWISVQDAAHPGSTTMQNIWKYFSSSILYVIMHVGTFFTMSVLSCVCGVVVAGNEKRKWWYL